MLPVIFDPEEAMKPDALLIYPEYGTNLFHSVGDPALCYQDYSPKDLWEFMKLEDYLK